MRALEIFLNGEKLCVAGIGNNGVLSAIVTWAAGKSGADSFLEVGGLISTTNKHFSWVRQKHLQTDDEIQVKVVEATTVDEPSGKIRPIRQGKLRVGRSTFAS
jgi:hypothetical protein